MMHGPAGAEVVLLSVAAKAFSAMKTMCAAHHAGEAGVSKEAFI